MLKLIGPDHAEEKLDPSPEEVEIAIRRLDGDERSMVTIAAGDPVPHLAVAGGRDAAYLVYFTPDNNSFYNLLGADRSGERWSLSVDRQESDYPIKWRTTLDQAVQAAAYFSKFQKCDPSLEWEIP